MISIAAPIGARPGGGWLHQFPAVRRHTESEMAHSIGAEIDNDECTVFIIDDDTPLVSIGDATVTDALVTMGLIDPDNYYVLRANALADDRRELMTVSGAAMVWALMRGGLRNLEPVDQAPARTSKGLSGMPNNLLNALRTPAACAPARRACAACRRRRAPADR